MASFPSASNDVNNQDGTSKEFEITIYATKPKTEGKTGKIVITGDTNGIITFKSEDFAEAHGVQLRDPVAEADPAFLFNKPDVTGKDGILNNVADSLSLIEATKDIYEADQLKSKVRLFFCGNKHNKAVFWKSVSLKSTI